MPDSPPARRILGDAMKQKAETRVGPVDPYPNDPPGTPFGKWLREQPIEARYREPFHDHAPRPLHPYRSGPAVGLAIVTAGLVLAWWFGLRG